MASATGIEPSSGLRARYAVLARKYADLVERLERKATHDLAIYRLNAFGPRTTGAALALVGRGRIQIANARFTQLARSVKGGLVNVEPQGGPDHPGLRRLVQTTSEGMLRDGVSALEARYRDAGASALFLLRFERALHSGESVILVVAEDVSEHARRDQELARTREALLQRERLRVLGQLAASIAHDLGNTLRSASFQLATIRDGALSPEKRADALSAVAKRVEIASEGIARLHHFARTGALKVGAVRLDRIVDQAAALVDTDFRSSAAPVHVRIALPELPLVRGSAAELSLLFVNLLCNARDAMPDGGAVKVAAQRTPRGVVVSVADEGTGIPPEVQRRLFEPFFTTKGSHGAGLGLWLASGTMERLGGQIRVTNRPGRGALVALTFPFVTAGESRRPPSAKSQHSPRSRKPQI